MRKSSFPARKLDRFQSRYQYRIVSRDRKLLCLVAPLERRYARVAKWACHITVPNPGSGTLTYRSMVSVLSHVRYNLGSDARPVRMKLDAMGRYLGSRSRTVQGLKLRWDL